ncbi:MAG: hypothetical protein E6Q97_10960 [Desulfurellales bacterium]|nr:MAG: hypothetical protein E6Q97_10960 [Desulfurellales bacterium]
MSRYFLNGWLAVAYSIILACIPFWASVIGPEGGYDWTQYLWLVGAAVFVTGVRAYQYFIQKR